mgnify:CR=1 FL=1
MDTCLTFALAWLLGGGADVIQPSTKREVGGEGNWELGREGNWEVGARVEKWEKREEGTHDIIRHAIYPEMSPCPLWLSLIKIFSHTLFQNLSQCHLDLRARKMASSKLTLFYSYN